MLLIGIINKEFIVGIVKLLCLQYFIQTCIPVMKKLHLLCKEAENKKEKKYNANCFHKTYSSQVTLTLRVVYKTRKTSSHLNPFRENVFLIVYLQSLFIVYAQTYLYFFVSHHTRTFMPSPWFWLRVLSEALGFSRSSSSV